MVVRRADARGTPQTAGVAPTDSAGGVLAGRRWAAVTAPTGLPPRTRVRVPEALARRIGAVAVRRRVTVDDVVRSALDALSRRAWSGDATRPPGPNTWCVWRLFPADIAALEVVVTAARQRGVITSWDVVLLAAVAAEVDEADRAATTPATPSARVAARQRVDAQSATGVGG